MKRYLGSICLFLIFLASLLFDEYFLTVYIETAILLLMILKKLGNGIVLRELIAFHMVLICLLVPILGYTIYDRTNVFALKWVRYMPVPIETYYGFCLPAVSIFAFAITLPMKKSKAADSGESIVSILERVKKQVAEYPLIGVWLMIIGVIMLYMLRYVPATLQFIVNLFWMASFAGFLYVFYIPRTWWKKFALLGYVAFILMYSMALGMFTIITYMGMLLFSFLFLGKKTGLVKKVAFFTIGVLVVLIIQSIKPIYRKYTWESKYEGNRVSLFYKLIVTQISEGSLFNEEAFFPIYYRANQGFNVALVMQRIPKFADFDAGENLSTKILASFVPRFLWPDKPEAGGRANMAYYAGFNVVGFSTNVGPLGEAYGSFGRIGGVLYMFILGIFIRWAYGLVFRAAVRVPAIILWLPVLFFQVTYSAEADTLQIMNSLIKSGIFVLFLYVFLPRLFFKKNLFGKRRTAVRRNLPDDQRPNWVLQKV